MGYKMKIKDGHYNCSPVFEFESFMDAARAAEPLMEAIKPAGKICVEIWYEDGKPLDDD